MRNDYLGSCYSTLAYPALTTTDVIPVITRQTYEEITVSTAQYSVSGLSYAYISVTTAMPTFVATQSDGLIPALGACDYATKATIVNTLPTTAIIHYSKGTIASTLTISQYSITTTCSDTSFVYEAYSDNIKTPLPTFVTFNPTTREFTFNSLVDSDAGNYQIAVFATLTNAQVDISYFNLTVKSPCELASWTDPTVSDLNYVLNDPMMTVTFPAA